MPIPTARDAARRTPPATPSTTPSTPPPATAPDRPHVAPSAPGTPRPVRAMVSAARPWAAVATVVGAVAAGTLLLPASLGSEARAALFSFALAIVLWSMTSLPAAWVALVGVLVLVGLGGAEQEALFASLSSDVIWLMIGAFVLGGAVTATGLATRLTGLVTRRASTVGGVLWALTVLLLPLSMLIPSTSGRAAVLLPVHRSLSRAADDHRVTRALSLLIPTVILVSTISTLVGAGSHLIANDLLHQVTGDRLTFGEWALYGVPFGLAACLIACAAVQWLFLDRETRSRPLVVAAAPRTRLTAAEWRTLAVTAAMVALWVTEAAHGMEIATVAVVGAVVLTMPGPGVISWKAGVQAVSWNLVVFVGAALVLGEALIDTGAALWIIERLFAASGIAEAGSVLVVLLVLTLITLTSHIYMTSHAARAAALVPAVLYLGQSLDLNPVAMVFIGTVGMDYCLTLPVSSKALLMYAELDEPTFDPPDLLRLSTVLLAAHLALVVAFYYGYWQFVGLAL